MTSTKLYISTDDSGRTAQTNSCEPEPVQCESDCLVQPRFFCGQLLTDQDLNALLEWAKGKHRLDRHIDGWGVAQGLSVQCASDEDCGIIVNPGTAIDPCGNDIVVCEPAKLDLSKLCRAPISECDSFTVDKSGSGECNGDGLDLRAIDLYIHYEERPEVPIAALPVGTCRTSTACKMSRTREEFGFTWREVPCESDPLAEAADRWSSEYHRCFEVIHCLIKDFPDLVGRGSDIKAWLLDWLERNPLHQFCFLAGDLAQRGDTDFEDAAQLSQILFWIVQDCRNQFLSKPYRWNIAGKAVPLARVWIGRQVGSNGDWWPIYVDNKPPYRRRLGLDRLPAPLGYTNLAELIWCRYDDACKRLRDWNIPFAVELWESVPSTPAELLAGLDCDPIVPCGQRIGLQILRQQGVAQQIPGNRVVGFCGELEPLPTPAPTQTPVPTTEPTINPTAEPTVAPDVSPTIRPTIGPTIRPTIAPTVRPTIRPTVLPTIQPTLRPGPIDGPIFRPQDFPGREVTEVNGIGEAFRHRLSDNKVDNLATLASMQPTELAKTLEVSEVRAMAFIDQARDLLKKPKE